MGQPYKKVRENNYKINVLDNNICTVQVKWPINNNYNWI